MELSKLAEAQSLLFALRETTLESFGLDLFFDWTPSWPSLKMELFFGVPQMLVYVDTLKDNLRDCYIGLSHSLVMLRLIRCSD